MVNEKMCPVCGYEMAEGPRDYNICPSCGTEFGIHDVNSSIRELREVWVANNLQWHSKVIERPPNWDPWLQLIRVFSRMHQEALPDPYPSASPIVPKRIRKRQRHRSPVGSIRRTVDTSYAMAAFR